MSLVVFPIKPGQTVGPKRPRCMFLVMPIDIDADDAPAHQYLQSVHNIVIERGWLRLRLEWGYNIATFWAQGVDNGIYRETNTKHCTVARWLWSTIVCKNLQQLKERFNARKTKKDRRKKLTSGGSADDFVALPEHYGGKSCLHIVDRAVVKNMMESMGGCVILVKASGEVTFIEGDIYRLGCDNGLEEGNRATSSYSVSKSPEYPGHYFGYPEPGFAQPQA